jgi:hypothetical protein
VTKYTVEFIQKLPSEVTKHDGFLIVECIDISEAIQIEKRFHDVGWVARVVSVQITETRNYPTAGIDVSKR